MRILMFCQSPDAIGPAPGIASTLAHELRRLGCSVEVHPWGRSSSEESVVARMVGTLRDVRSARRRTRQDTFDLALVHTAHDWRTLVRDIPLALALRRRKVPVVLHLHGSRPERLSGIRPFRGATALLMRLVGAVLVLSRDEQAQWEAFTSRPVLLVRNPYVPRMTGVPIERPNIGVGTVLFVGRLLRQKGVFELLEAMPLVAERGARCRLDFVGDGPAAAELRARVDALDLVDTVTFAGYVTGAELVQAYAGADVLALPTYSEGFATVLTEAMDAGLPIVTTPIRGAADLLVEREHVLFVEPRDVAGLAAALVSLLENPSLRRRMGEANRRLLADFEPAVVASGYLSALETVVADSNPPHGDSG
jgi:glycosyltransferase involved in cell wall biosynthesis